MHLPTTLSRCGLLRARTPWISDDCLLFIAFRISYTLVIFLPLDLEVVLRATRAMRK